MPLQKEKFREIVFQILYSHNLGYNSGAELIELISKELSVSKKIVKEAQKRVEEICKHLAVIDEKIKNISHAYAFERIQTVEKNILRLGMYELLYDRSIPYKVIIAEAKRLTKKFCTKEAAAFIHAILDAAYKEDLGQAFNSDQLSSSARELEQSEHILKEVEKELNNLKDV